MKKYYFTGLLLILAGLFAYHFIAENQAEEQIETAIQEQFNKSFTRQSMQYSTIEVSSFRGDISLGDVTVIQDATIRRSSHILMDLSYWDFLKIYLMGLQYGLENLEQAQIRLLQPSQVNRETLAEVKFDTLHINYTGNAWDGILSIAHDSTFQTDHTLEVNGSSFRYTGPGSGPGAFKSNDFNLNLTFAKGSSLLLPGGSGSSELTTLTWSPPAGVQQNYSFFIKGLGFQPDSIPVRQAEFSWEMEPSLPRIELKRGKISTELCQIKLEGDLITGPSFKHTKINAATVSITDFSEQFARILDNVEKIFNISLPKQGDSIVFQIGGTLEKPFILDD